MHLNILMVIIKNSSTLHSHLTSLVCVILCSRDGKIPRFARCIGKKVNDAMHRFKKCASDTIWLFVSRCIVSNVFASVKITSGCKRE